MASFNMPSAHCKQQATEDPEYENKIQETMNGLYSGDSRVSGQQELL